MGRMQINVFSQLSAVTVYPSVSEGKFERFIIFWLIKLNKYGITGLALQ